MWKTGHSLIKKKMKETGALLAGEMSGHIFFKERWFGFDDGIYSAARLLEILSQDKRDAEHVFSAFPSDISTPEINITVTDENKFRLIERLQRRRHLGRRQPHHPGRRARRLSQGLGPGTRLQHHAGAGAALRSGHRGRARAHQGSVPRPALHRSPDINLPF